jgi:hypothetical protein
MDTQKPVFRQFAPCDDEADVSVETWTIEELAADLVSVQSALAQTHDWQA